MNRVAVISDIHFGARSENVNYTEYQKNFFEFFFKVIDEEGITEILNLGDVFDRRKFVNFQTLRNMKKFYYDQLASRGLNEHFLIGNHDTYFKSTNDINSPSLILTPYIKNLIWKEPKILNILGEQILFVPWISSDNKDICLEYLSNASTKIIVGHFEINGFEMNKGVYCDHGIEPNIFEKFDLVLSGHFHQKSSGPNRRINYVGSPFEMNWGDYGEDRGFHLLDLSSKELTFIKNPFTLFKAISSEEITDRTDYNFYRNSFVKVIVNSKTSPKKIDLIREKMMLAGVADLKLIEELPVTDEQLRLNVNLVDTLSMIHEHIDNDDMITIDKNSLKIFISEVYKDAMDVEIET